ncbi:MAG: glycosyltransferase family 4 protein [Desulfobaccales bacterium]
MIPDPKYCETMLRVMVFSLAVGGHHDEFLLHLVRFWCHQDIPGRLFPVVSPRFLTVNAEAVNSLAAYVPEKLCWSPLTPEEIQRFESQRWAFKKSLMEWALLRHYAVTLRVTQGLIMFLDTFQTPLSLRLRAPCNLAGVYFRPTFHYKNYGWYHPSVRDCRRDLRKEWLMRWWLRHPALKTIFCLDPLAVEPLKRYSGHTDILYVPDPVETTPGGEEAGAELRRRLGIGPEARVFLLFGAITVIKGVFQVLEALNHLSPPAATPVVLLLAGQAQEDLEAQLQKQVQTLRSHPSVQVIRLNQYIPYQEVGAYFAMADVVLAPYQRHVGSSGILMRAAAAGKPVLASDYGLMGELVRQHCLGITVDASQPPAIAAGMLRFLQQAPETLFDEVSAGKFAAEHSPEKFAQALCQGLLGFEDR